MFGEFLKILKFGNLRMYRSRLVNLESQMIQT